MTRQSRLFGGSSLQVFTITNTITITTLMVISDQGCGRGDVMTYPNLHYRVSTTRMSDSVPHWQNDFL